MKLITFPDYEQYVAAQRRTLSRRGMGPYFNGVQIWKNCDWLRRFLGRGAEKGICHGARNGLECDEFKKHFPSVTVFGTDLFPFSGRSALHRGKSEVVQHDFSLPKPEWTGAFDFVYSNSLDHARDPVVAVQLWLSQLKGDDFGASLWEWVQLGNLLGRTVELIYSKVEWSRTRRRCLESVTVCVSPDKNCPFPCKAPK